MNANHRLLWLLLFWLTLGGCAASAVGNVSTDQLGGSLAKGDSAEAGTCAEELGFSEDPNLGDQARQRSLDRWSACVTAETDAITARIDSLAADPGSSTVAADHVRVRETWSALCRQLVADEPDEALRADALVRCRGAGESHLATILERFTLARPALEYVPAARECTEVCSEQLNAGLGERAEQDMGAASIEGEKLLYCVADVVTARLRDRFGDDSSNDAADPALATWAELRTAGSTLCDALGATELAAGGAAHPLFYYGCDASVADALLAWMDR